MLSLQCLICHPSLTTLLKLSPFRRRALGKQKLFGDCFNLLGVGNGLSTLRMNPTISHVFVKELLWPADHSNIACSRPASRLPSFPLPPLSPLITTCTSRCGVAHVLMYIKFPSSHWSMPAIHFPCLPLGLQQGQFSVQEITKCGECWNATTSLCSVCLDERLHSSSF